MNVDLLHSLSALRQHASDTVHGLSDTDLLGPVLPSGWSMASMLRHLAVDVELFWFAGVVAGDADVLAHVQRNESGYVLPAGCTGAQAVDDYRAAIERADFVIDDSVADRKLAWWPEFFGPPWLHSLADVTLHVITETAVHCGHLDAARELIDGQQHLVLD